jgi:serine/threonine-protein kinase RsbW
MEQLADGTHDAATLVSSSWQAKQHMLSACRDHVRAWLRRLGYPTDTNDDLVVAVNEAVTNAMVHAYPPDEPGATFELSLWCEQDMACIAVRDHGRWRSSASTRFGGHGITLMRGLVHTVDIKGDEAGTSVTFRHPLPATSP